MTARAELEQKSLGIVKAIESHVGAVRGVASIIQKHADDEMISSDAATLLADALDRAADAIETAAKAVFEAALTSRTKAG